MAAFDPDRSLDRYTKHALTEYPTENGPADYALVVAGRILGIVEAKKVSLGPQGLLDACGNIEAKTIAEPVTPNRPRPTGFAGGTPQ